MPLPRALAFLRALTQAGAQDRVVLDAGVLLRSPQEPYAYVANQLLLDRADGLDARAVIALLDDRQRGLMHRRAFVQDDREGARLHRALLTHGWGGGAEVVMVLPAGVDPGAPERARAADDARLRTLERRTNDELGLPEPVVEQLVRVRRRAARAIGAQGFVAAASDGGDAAHATVYGAGPVAQIDDVATLLSARGQGLAKDVVRACVAHARAGGAEVVFLTADADDWPQHLYAGLGFVTVGRVWVLQREGLEPA